LLSLRAISGSTRILEDVEKSAEFSAAFDMQIEAFIYFL